MWIPCALAVVAGEITDLPAFPPFPESWASPELDTRGLVIGDVDGDGVRDVVAAVEDDDGHKLIVFESDGAGGFTEVYRTPVAEMPGVPLWHVAVGDTDGDGQRELIAQDQSNILGVHMWEAVGDDTFEPRGLVAWVGAAQVDGELSQGVRVADLDGDGKKELVFAIGSFLSGETSRIFVHEHAGEPGDNTYARIYEYQAAPLHDLRDFNVGDSDGDGRNEILWTEITLPLHPPRFHRLEYDGAGGFDAAEFQFLDACGSLWQPALGDFDFDGDRELAFSVTMLCNAEDMEGYGLIVLEAVADDTYELVYQHVSTDTTDVGASPSLAIGEFSCLPFPTPVVGGGGGIQIYSWHPEGYDPILAAPIEARPGSLALRDMDADGAPDLVTSGRGAEGSSPQSGIHVFRQHTWCYGSGVNPIESLLILGGAPELGTVLTMGVDDPTGAHAVGSLPFVVLSTAPDPSFPAGTTLPGFGMAGLAAPGELLVSFGGPWAILAGAPWQGATFPAPVEVPIPDLPILAGLSLYAQGVLFDPSLHGVAHWGLAEGMVLPVSQP